VQQLQDGPRAMLAPSNPLKGEHMSAFAPRSLAVRTSRSLVVLLALAAPPSAQSSGQTTDTGRALSIQYADGKVINLPLRPTGGVGMTSFPRIAGVDTSRDGVRLTTLDVKYVVERTDIVVTVTLCYGGPDKNPLKVATVRVSPGTPVIVHKLRAHGVEPITLSLVSIPNTVAYVPEALSASAQVDVRVEPVGPNVSARMPGCDGVMIHTERARYRFAADSSPDTRPRTNPVARVESPPRFRVVVASGSFPEG
jgi:hypothetical protein